MDSDPFASADELSAFGEALSSFLAGRLSPREFRPLRAPLGVYGQRDDAAHCMIRLRVPQGEVSSEHLLALLPLLREVTSASRLHLTTRQQIELHGVPWNRVREVLQSLASAGWSTRDTGGSTVRNVTACPWSGLRSDQAFDILPMARAVADHFLNHPLGRHLPRKVKIAFECCQADHVGAMVNDIGCFAVRAEDRRGFQIYVGGGLGRSPRAATLLEAFTPEERLLATCEAIVTVHQAWSDRTQRATARLKFLVEAWGLERFREAVDSVRNNLPSSRPWAAEDADPPAEFSPTPEDFPGWPDGWVVAQRDHTFVTLQVAVPTGDLSDAHVRVLSTLARDRACGMLRLTPTQDVLIPFMPRSALTHARAALSAVGLFRTAGLGRITRCVGLPTCLSAQNAPAELLERLYREGVDLDPHRSLHLSGCANGCGHHLLGDIGLMGVVQREGGAVRRCWQLFTGGQSQRGQVTFGEPGPILEEHQVVEALRVLQGQAGYEPSLD